MNIGFITFSTENWKDILDNLVESVLLFSKYDITVNSINFDYKHSNPRVSVKRINLHNPTYCNICKQKIVSVLDSSYDIALILDADMIVTKEIDKIFEENLEKIQLSDFPLFSKHPHNPFYYNKDHVMPIVRMITDRIPQMNYVYASFLFSSAHKRFFQEVLDLMNKYEGKIFSDEYVINALLTKYAVRYDIGYNYLPNGSESIINQYLNNEENCEELKKIYINNNCQVKFYIFHGYKCKDVKYSKELILKLRDKK